MQLDKAIRIRAGGKGAIGSQVRAPTGKYVHARKASPVKFTKYRTITKNGKTIRLGYNPGTKAWETQSVLTPTRGKK